MTDRLRQFLLFATLLWPLWLSWPLAHAGMVLWRDWVIDPTASIGTVADWQRHVWPGASLVGPILILLGTCTAARFANASRITAIASLAGVLIALAIVLLPEWRALAPYIAHTPAYLILRAAAGHLYALLAGGFALAIGYHLLWGEGAGVGKVDKIHRGRSDNFGHADWLPIPEALRLYPGPDDRCGGIVIGEAYRVDRDRRAGRRRFDPWIRR